MAIQSVGEVWSDRRGSIDEMFIRRYTRVFRVLTTAGTDGAQLVRTAVGIPNLGDGWTDGTNNDQGARCYEIDPQQDQDDPVAWLVRCEYTSARPSGTNRNPALFVQAGNLPILQPPEVTFDYEMYRRPISKDALGVVILNSAGVPFDPPLEVDAHRLVMRIEWNSFFYDPVVGLAYVDGVNSDNWLGFEQYTCKIRKWGGEIRFQDGIVFWRRMVEIEFRQETFLYSVLDHGFQVLTSEGKLANAVDPNGQPYSGAVLLNGEGGLLEVGGDPYYLGPYHVYPEIGFNGTDIPNISDLLGTQNPGP